MFSLGRTKNTFCEESVFTLLRWCKKTWKSWFFWFLATLYYPKNTFLIFLKKQKHTDRAMQKPSESTQKLFFHVNWIFSSFWRFRHCYRRFHFCKKWKYWSQAGAVKGFCTFIIDTESLSRGNHGHLVDSGLRSKLLQDDGNYPDQIIDPPFSFPSLQAMGAVTAVESLVGFT